MRMTNPGRWPAWLALLFTCTAAWAGGNDVLLIESYHGEYSWDASYLKGLKQTLDPRWKLSLFEMDTKRQPPERFRERADLAWKRYQELKPALVILGDDNAMKYLGPKLAATNTPTVFLGINGNPRGYVDEQARNFTGVLERPLFKRSIATVARVLKTRPRKILVLFDSGTTSQTAVREAFASNLSAKVLGIEVKLRMIQRMSEWQWQVNRARSNGYDAIIVGLYHTLTDGQGGNVPATRVLQWTHENTQAPLFAFWDFAVGAQKTAGGLVLSGEKQGVMAGRIANRVLDGTPPEKIFPKTSQQGRYLFSQSQITRYDLKLPDSLKPLTTIIQ